MFYKSEAEDQEFMADVRAAAAARARPLARITLYVAAAFFIAAWLWARQAVLDEVTLGSGRVIPSSQVQLVQNLEGGILAELQVKEGQVVERGQVLLRIDDTRAASSYREGRARYLSLLAMVARLTAEAQGSAPAFPEEVRREAPDLIRIETSLYQSRQSALYTSIESLRKSHALANQELQMTAPLLDKGAISEVEVLRLRRQVSELSGQMEERRSRFRADAALELNKVKAELAGLSENNVASRDRVNRTLVRSPVHGVVKKLNVTTVGQVIQPGVDILEIVPLEDSLLVEAQIRPADIAFLHPGQEATVKVSAYDYSIYGGLPAVLEHISADSITDEKKGESYYRIRVRTRRNYLGSEAKPLPIIPGMTASVEILTGQKTVLDYLLKPLLKARERALRER